MVIIINSHNEIVIKTYTEQMRRYTHNGLFLDLDLDLGWINDQYPLTNSPN